MKEKKQIQQDNDYTMLRERVRHIVEPPPSFRQKHSSLMDTIQKNYRIKMSVTRQLPTNRRHDVLATIGLRLTISPI